VRKSDNTLLASYDYHVRADGLRDEVLESRRTNTTGTYSTVDITWAYDDLGRLKSELRDDGDNGPSADDYLTKYDYDLAGNRIHQRIDRGDDGDHISSETDASFDEIITSHYDEPSPVSYNRDDHLFSTTDVNGSTTTVTTYTYDPNGSTISKSVSINGGTASVTQYGYDVRSRLVVLDPNGDDTRDSTTGALTANTGDTTYVTDDDGDRVSQTTNGQTTQYLVDKQNPTGYSQVIEEKTPGSSAPNVSYAIGNDVIAQAKGTSTPALQFLLYDGHGSTRELLGANGVPIFEANSTTVYAHVDYDAFGNGVGSSSLNAFAGYVSLLYSGEQYDSGLGEQYLRARYYDQTIGRFSSFDTFEGNTTEPSTLHKFVYTGNDGINAIDPTGKFVLFADLQISTAGRLLLAAGILAGLGLSAVLMDARLRHAVTNALNEAVDTLWEAGTSAATTAAVTMMSNTAVVVGAIAKAVTAARVSSINLPPLFPIIRSLGSKVYANDVAALATNPAWFTLTYNGPNNPLTPAKRTAAIRGYVGRAPLWWESLDEFPYASTAQGGARSSVVPVPATENWTQGGLLSAFYRLRLMNATLNPTGNMNFMVVPIPL
jgi:RHS repeat-associated protein